MVEVHIYLPVVKKSSMEKNGCAGRLLSHMGGKDLFNWAAAAQKYWQIFLLPPLGIATIDL